MPELRLVVSLGEPKELCSDRRLMALIWVHIGLKPSGRQCRFDYDSFLPPVDI